MIYLLESDELWFPDVSDAEEDGLLMIGGDLSPERLQLAYSRGIFPWFEDQGALFWYAPDPRLVLFPDKVNVSKSMQKVMKSGQFQITLNSAFDRVIEACADVPRKNQPGTWISADFITGYTALHSIGTAHSVEVWQEGELVGGLYGVEVNGGLSGESMFSKIPNASKAALIWLCRSGHFRFIDCQVGTDHLKSMGAGHISRESFVKLLNNM
jgi:leucyl/phenylalanyl-tRNA--protein transferase